MPECLLRRRSVLLLPLAVMACADDSPTEPAAAQTFQPLRYDYLNPIQLNVASIEVQQSFVPGGGDLGSSDPAPPADTLRRMAEDRLHALGSGGKAVFVIKDASLTQNQGSYVGTFAVELDVYASDGTRAGFAEATVSRTAPVGDQPQAAALYDMTRTLMDSTNVEFEYQVRRSLRDWLITAPDVIPEPVQQQDLAPPS